ncbi:MAG: hypothetical protein B0D92_06290 [Spirochaeta sp. LUC14_002_19_P3]|nr:MAG: hypothetical protein B0D92_06290 [Spirochaeta sp. LUC14_002_19_P3]
MSTKHAIERTLGLPEVCSIASGAMISSGLFVLPALIYAEAGNNVIAVYLLAGLMMIPSILSKAELSAAMPSSGGTYFFVERSLGPLLGAFAGFASWVSIALKGAFALVGIGTFWSLINPGASGFTFKAIALGFVLVFTLVNLGGVHGTAKSQVIMVIGLIGILTAYIVSGFMMGGPVAVSPFSFSGMKGILPLAGMVFVSFGGVTKIASVGHQIKNPGRNLPLGMFISFVAVMIIYLLAIGVTARLLDAESFSNTFTPLSAGAAIIAGRPGMIALAVAALLAFATTANASILSASQNPAAMARDGLLPAWLGKTNGKNVPVPAILITSSFMALVIVLLDLPNLIKAASTMMLILFLLVNLSLILMRESRIVSYRPEFKVPFYPLIPVCGILVSCLLIYTMGAMPLLLSSGFFLFTALWTILYRRGSPKRDSALFRIVERMAARELQGTRLTDELGSLLRERDGVSEDRFDRLIRKAIILDLPEQIPRTVLFEKLAAAFSLRLETPYQKILDKLEARETESATLVSSYLAIPHIVLDQGDGFEIVMVRAKNGILYDEGKDEPTMVFALAGAAGERNFHLKCLMAIAQITRSADFISRWNTAFDEEELRLLVLLAERSR